MMKRYLGTVLLLIASFAYGQTGQVWLHPNRGQWDSRISYKVELQQGAMFVGPKEFVYHFAEVQNHDHTHDHSGVEEGASRGHVIRTSFIGASGASAFEESQPSSFYRNYFLSNNPDEWKSEVYSAKEVLSRNVYPGIDMQLQGGNAELKYSWIVAPGTDCSVIRWNYEGAERIGVLPTGELNIAHSLGSITEGKPVAWTIRNGKKQPVSVQYRIEGDEVVFALGQNVFSDTLIIDPSLTFSTFTGSLADNWGFTAAPDPNGNLFAGGIVFGSGYPVSAGPYDGSFNGGGGAGGAFMIDVGITKFNATGTNIIYSTYLGGSGNETPHSVVTGPTGELFILGVTSSPNFPMAGISYDNSFNGGPAVMENSLGFDGTDIYIARFNAAGTNLLASTYIGGSGTDGINLGTARYNYGDQFRGEIIVRNGNVYVASVSQSTNFPTQNPVQATLSGPQDAVFFEMNLGLSAFQWSTYFGGSGYETGNSIQASSSGDVYVTGGTTSSGLPFPQGHDLTYNGGLADGYLVRLSGVSGNILAGTYIGSPDYDQSYFVQLDLEDQVYVYGQTEGSMPITAGCYGNLNSGQFVSKYTTNLSALTWTTVVGAGTGHVEISPTAFLVSNCKDIYLSGWGGTVNTSSQAVFSSSSGFPVTADAYQSSTNGSNFWIAVLGEDASFLKYATYMGGTTSSSNHVDGGTSRFDKNGSIYHAVCGACGGNDNGFTTTPQSWSPTNPSPNCNLAAFKFELSNIEAIISDPEPLICLPDPVVFQNNSANGNSFFWDFGDNTFSTDVNPSHVYASAGQYTVTLIVSDTNECFVPDTVEFLVNIGDFEGGIVEPPGSICPGQSYQFEAYGGSSYVWSPAQFLNNPNIFNPVATVTQNTQFTCIISDSCGVDTVSVWLNVFGGSVQVSNDTTICVGSSVPLHVDGVVTATWSPGTYLDNPSSTNPVSTPANDITYTVIGTTVDGCQLNEQVTIDVVFDEPDPQMPDTLTYCQGLSAQVTVGGADQYTWSPPIDITPLTGPTVTISSETERYYYCEFTNACGTEIDSMYVNLVSATVTAGNDTIVCPGEPAFMFATGGISYVWSPSVSHLVPNGSQVSDIAPEPTNYMVVGTNPHGCVDSAFVMVDLYPQPFIQTNPDVYAMMGEPVQLSAISSTPGPYVWSPAEYLSCVVCETPIAQPDQNFTYTVTYTDENGCSASDKVRIIYDAIIYVPNAFTPDGNSLNSEFFAVGGNIKSLTLEIWNRWGELIYTGGLNDKAWDGTYKSLPCPDGVYTWKIEYVDFMDNKRPLVGHVTLLR